MKKHATMILALVFFVSVMLEPVAALATGGIVEKDVRASAQTAAVESATKIDLDKTVSGSCPAGGAVYYKFKTGSACAQYHIKLQNKGASEIEFWVDDEYEYVSPGTTFTWRWILDPNSWYSIVVRNDDDSSVDFSLTVNNHFAIAKALMLGKKVNAKDGELFKFKTLNDSSLYTVQSDATYELDGKKGIEEYVTVGGDGLYKLPKNTWFTAYVYNDGAMCIQDTYSISKILKLGTKKTSQKCSAGKRVWYRFKTKSNNSHYRVTLNNGNGGKANLSVYNAYVKAGDVERVFKPYASRSISSHSKDSILLKPARNNWCYVVVEAPASTANYSIIVKEEKDNGGDTFASAKKIGQATQKGYFNGSLDSDWFKFTAPVSGSYQLTLKRVNSDNMVLVQVYNRDEEEIDGWKVGWANDQSGYTRNLTLKGLRKGETIWLEADSYYSEPESDSRYTLSVKYKTSPTSVSSLTSKTRSIKVKWKKKTAVSGYQIKCSSSKTFSKSKTKTVTVKGNSKSSKTITKLKKGKKYYVKVRSYRVINGKRYYSKWSKVKTIKTKK